MLGIVPKTQFQISSHKIQLQLAPGNTLQPSSLSRPRHPNSCGLVISVVSNDLLSSPLLASAKAQPPERASVWEKAASVPSRTQLKQAVSGVSILSQYKVRSPKRCPIPFPRNNAGAGMGCEVCGHGPDTPREGTGNSIPTLHCLLRDDRDQA